MLENNLILSSVANLTGSQYTTILGVQEDTTKTSRTGLIHENSENCIMTETKQTSKSSTQIL